MDTVSLHRLAWWTSTQVLTKMSLPPGNFPWPLPPTFGHVSLLCADSILYSPLITFIILLVIFVFLSMSVPTPAGLEAPMGTRTLDCTPQSLAQCLAFSKWWVVGFCTPTSKYCYKAWLIKTNSDQKETLSVLKKRTHKSVIFMLGRNPVLAPRNSNTRVLSSF